MMTWDELPAVLVDNTFPVRSPYEGKIASERIGFLVDIRSIDNLENLILGSSIS